MNVFSFGKEVRCYQNWNGICWNRETVAMEKWSNTAPCSCHALMSMIFLREKEEKKQWGWKGNVMERRGRFRRQGRVKGINGQTMIFSQGERVKDRRILLSACSVWLRSSRPDALHENDLTLCWTHQLIARPLPPSYHLCIQHLIFGHSLFPQSPDD